MRYLILGILLSLGTIPAASAQCQQQSIRSQLTSVSERMSEIGYPMIYLTYCGSMGKSDSQFHDLELYGGVAYKIFAVCDGDCPDLDLKLYDEKGNLVDEDTLEDYTPIVEVSPTAPTRYRAKVIMYECETEPCYYAIRAVAE
ncbi:hypothetical protein CLV84_1127 [Neolewinella xylanilytica]|uniref:Uncharacterized protein n=1 Tax=Neolewinella xylanilytica TaxID=1514080 RepID=A0A2S6I9L1_9BACT|nr:hypothetical protein [Neolewinella xylanilytica]PPK88162.1 hypothetical protein CLV84_1127 [Neolewinella xylanilytica]